MTSLTRSIAMLLLAVWLPVTMHCELEAAPEFSFLRCCCGSDEAPGNQDDCDESFCCVVESGFYKIEEDQFIVSPQLSTISWSTLPLARYLAQFRNLAAPEPQPPPEISGMWQFSTRAAPEPRAPSILS